MGMVVSIIGKLQTPCPEPESIALSDLPRDPVITKAILNKGLGLRL